MESTPFLIEHPEFFPLAIIAGSLAMAFVLSFMSGWRRLGESFPVRHDVEGERFIGVSGSMGRSRYLAPYYRNCANVIVSTDGAGLSMPFLFRAFHPPLFIPWQAIASVTPEKNWGRKTAVLSLRDSPTQIRIKDAAGEAILAAYLRHGTSCSSAPTTSNSFRPALPEAKPQPVLSLFGAARTYWLYFLPGCLLPLAIVIGSVLQTRGISTDIASAPVFAWFLLSQWIARIPMRSNKLSAWHVLFWSFLAPALSLPLTGILGIS